MVISQTSSWGTMMSEVLAFKPIVERRNTRRARRLALITDIIQALEKCGGTAHYEIIINHIAAERKLIDPPSREALRRQILDVFLANCETEEGARERAMFRRVYGPESRRWGLARAFYEQIQHGMVDLEQH